MNDDPKVGDLIQMITWRSTPEDREVGVVLRVGERHGGRRVATVFTIGGREATWPLDSHYDIEVISEGR